MEKRNNICDNCIFYNGMSHTGYAGICRKLTDIAIEKSEMKGLETTAKSISSISVAVGNITAIHCEYFTEVPADKLIPLPINEPNSIGDFLEANGIQYNWNYDNRRTPCGNDKRSNFYWEINFSDQPLMTVLGSVSLDQFKQAMQVYYFDRRATDLGKGVHNGFQLMINDEGNDKKKIDRFLDKYKGIFSIKDPQIIYSEIVSGDSKITESKTELLDCIHNLMGAFDSPLARRKINSEFAEEVRKLARVIMEKNNRSTSPY